MADIADVWTKAQMSVIGSGLIDGSCVPLILAGTRPEDFSGEYRRYYDAFRQLAAENTTIDPVTVLNVLGPAYREMTADIMHNTPTSANVEAYIEVCREQSRLALLRQVGMEMAGAVSLDDARQALDRAAAVSLEADRQTGWTAAECAQEWFDALSADEKPEYIRCGIGALDNTLRTVAGNMVVIAGYTSHGKSALAMQMAWAASQTRRVGFFSFETGRKDWTDRLVSYVSKVAMEKVQDKNLVGNEGNAVLESLSLVYDRKLTYERAAGFTLDDIRARVLQKGYEIIFVDYLQKVVGKDRRRFGRYEEVSEISSGLQIMGQRYGVTVYALSQLNRPEKARGNGSDDFLSPPGLQNLRESGQIEQDADAVLFVHAPWKRSFPVFRILDVAKNRSGVLKSYYADFDGSVQTFTEPTQEHAESYRRLMQGKKIEGGGPLGGSRRFSKLTDTDPADNPFAQTSLAL